RRKFLRGSRPEEWVVSGCADRLDYWTRTYGVPWQELTPVRPTVMGAASRAGRGPAHPVGARRRGRTPERYGAWTSCIRGAWTSCIRGAWTSCIRGAWTSCIRGAWTSVTCASVNPESSTEEATTLSTAAKPFLIFFPP